MSEQTLLRRALKVRARETMRQMMAPCLTAAAVVLCVTQAGSMVLSRTGGLVFPGLLETAQLSVDTGLWQASPQWLTEMGLGAYAARGGVLAALRVESARMVMVYILPWAQVGPFALATALMFLLSTPARYGALGHLWRVAGGEAAPPKGIFSWYLDLRLTAKALALQLAVSLWQWLVQLLSMSPGFLLMVLFSGADGGHPVWLLIAALLVAGMLLGYCLSTLLVPARLLLAQRPEMGVTAALRAGWRALKGRRKAFFQLQLSFLPWQLVSMLTYQVADLFLFPYRQLSAMYFLDTTPEPPAEVW